MSHTTIFYVVVFATASLIAGWYGCKAWIAHGDISGTAKKVSGLRRARNHNGGVALLVLAIVLFILYDLMAKHR
ncbi:MAG TPA: hypothetical protein VFI65_08445 [Streptosporangiaceae bacterium]|nr:hypothetical protein [Streptosporangiaceae bacterium]